MTQNIAKKPKALEGVRVLEIGQLIAAPFASALLAWFGAEVIKIEAPGTGDPLRTWRVLHKGTALWWYSISRNKKSITVNLRVPKGQDIVRRLVKNMDVVIENFRPGTMEKWGLGYEDLKQINPRLIMTRVSGFGQTGPYASKPGFAAVAEGVGGLRYITGYPDRAPARPNLSLGDSLAGLHAFMGILLALYRRDVGSSATGQVVDVALYEAVFNMMESTVPEYDMTGVIREREGTRISGIVPTGTYPCSDGKFVIIGGNGDSIFKRLALAMERPDMASDPRFEHNVDRVRHVDEIDDSISAWTRQHPCENVLEVLEKAGVPSGPIYSAADMLSDPHFQARGLFEEVVLPDGETLKVPAFAPRLSETPGGTEWTGPKLGAHNHEVLGELLGYSDEDLRELASEGVI